MGEPNATQGDRIVGQDVHIEDVTTPAGQVPTPMTHSFDGTIENELASSVYADGKLLALLGSWGENSPEHTPQSGDFNQEPENKGTISGASSTVFANGVRVARNNDEADTCNDLGQTKNGHVIASGTVLSG